MRISKKNIQSLVNIVTLPFEQFIVNDKRLAKYLSDPEVAKVHNMAVTKLSIYIYADIQRAYDFIQEGAKAHQKEQIPIENLKEFYTLYFQLCRQWDKEHKEKDVHFSENLKVIEQFVYDTFAKESQSKENFYEYNSDAIKKDLEKMHYKQEEKINAQDFYEEGSIDNLEILDILECSNSLAELMQGDISNYDNSYFTDLKSLLETYAIILEKNMEFKDIGFSLSKLAQIIQTHLNELIIHKNQKTLIVILTAITEDLISWSNSVLVDKTAIDIHFLDASLLSSIIQFEMILTPTQKTEEDDDELEFF